ncbi:MAG: hypothetical protein HZA62_00515 [Rhodocyclales bacterium]|nr:hypothetical protein [Rhodocyclales bacterium]
MDYKSFDFHHSSDYSAFLSGLNSTTPARAKNASHGKAGVTETGGNT